MTGVEKIADMARQKNAGVAGLLWINCKVLERELFAVVSARYRNASSLVFDFAWLLDAPISRASLLL